jgi:hypothetical protein
MIHYVVFDEFGIYINAHTHGLEESYGHKDIQIVMPFGQYSIAEIMSECVYAISRGRTFEPGVSYSGLFYCDVQFIEVEEDNRKVLRMLIPDERGLLPSDPACEKVHRGQIGFVTD